MLEGRERWLYAFLAQLLRDGDAPARRGRDGQRPRRELTAQICDGVVRHHAGSGRLRRLAIRRRGLFPPEGICNCRL